MVKAGNPSFKKQTTSADHEKRPSLVFSRSFFGYYKGFQQLVVFDMFSAVLVLDRCF